MFILCVDKEKLRYLINVYMNLKYTLILRHFND